ncbi:hypothetical protein RRG08_061385 [Elysia crispata]|uniref:Uncharacterized protein n=1 Tax=Elysia crispata TaxID=231223 RepID=A0AAE1AFG4_9GAST|nr:hypothetical protein RRG08_061385 [Elysia crispata]
MQARSNTVLSGHIRPSILWACAHVHVSMATSLSPVAATRETRHPRVRGGEGIVGVQQRGEERREAGRRKRPREETEEKKSRVLIPSINFTSRAFP